MCLGFKVGYRLGHILFILYIPFHLDILIPVMDGIKQLLDVCVVILCLSAVLHQQLVEKTLLHLQLSFQLLHDLAGAQRDLTEESSC